MQAMALKDHLAKHFGELSPQLQRAARYISDHPEDVATRSLRKIASSSGLTPPTYSRLARAIGFDHYEDLRDSCRNEMRQKRLSLAGRAALLQENGINGTKKTRGSFAAMHARAAVSGIQNLLDELDAGQLADAADHLARANRIFLIGTMSSRPMVEYLAYIVQMAAENWQVVGQGASSAPATLASISKNDAVLAISVAPYSSETVRSVRFAASAGAKPVIISDDLLSPLLKHAKFSILVPTESPQFFPSHVAILTLLEILVGMVVRRLGDEGQNRINAVEQSSHAIGDYWQQ